MDYHKHLRPHPRPLSQGEGRLGCGFHFRLSVSIVHYQFIPVCIHFLPFFLGKKWQGCGFHSKWLLSILWGILILSCMTQNHPPPTSPLLGRGAGGEAPYSTSSSASPKLSYPVVITQSPGWRPSVTSYCCGFWRPMVMGTRTARVLSLFSLYIHWPPVAW